MSDRPRVTARTEIESVRTRAVTGESWETPEVVIEVSFDLHDHKAVLVALRLAVTAAEAKIRESSA